jgi:poly(3-hydroxybutyrate) depolymerase
VFHGDHDSTVAPINAAHLAADAVHALTGADGTASVRPAATTTGHAPGGHAFTRTAYHDPEGRTVVEHWTIHGAGHAWSGGSPAGSFTDPMDPNASTEFVRFFAAHPKPGRPADGRSRG